MQQCVSPIFTYKLLTLPSKSRPIESETEYTIEFNYQLVRLKIYFNHVLSKLVYCRDTSAYMDAYTQYNCNSQRKVTMPLSYTVHVGTHALHISDTSTYIQLLAYYVHNVLQESDQ